MYKILPEKKNISEWRMSECISTTKAQWMRGLLFCILKKVENFGIFFKKEENKRRHILPNPHSLSLFLFTFEDL